MVPGTAGVSTCHFVEIAEAVDAGARLVDLVAVVPAAFHLAHFAAHHLVARARVAGDIDAAHIDAAARIDEDGEGDLVLVLVDLRRRIDVGEGVAFVAQPLADRLGGLGQLLARKDVARLDLDQLGQLVLGQAAVRRPA